MCEGLGVLSGERIAVSTLLESSTYRQDDALRTDLKTRTWWFVGEINEPIYQESIEKGEDVDRTNEIIRKFCDSHEKCTYLDINCIFQNGDGTARVRIFVHTFVNMPVISTDLKPFVLLVAGMSVA